MRTSICPGVEIALEAAGYNVPDLYLSGGRAAAIAIDAIRAGRWDATLAYFPVTKGSLTMEHIANAIEDKPVTQAINMDTASPLQAMIDKAVLDAHPDFKGEWAQYDFGRAAAPGHFHGMGDRMGKHYRVSADIGGTFTDIVFQDNETGECGAAKVLSTPENPALSVLEGIKLAIPADATINFFVHGTTVGLNALLTRRGAKVALLTTHNFRDIYTIQGNDRGGDLFDPVEQAQTAGPLAIYLYGPWPDCGNGCRGGAAERGRSADLCRGRQA